MKHTISVLLSFTLLCACDTQSEVSTTENTAPVTGNTYKSATSLHQTMEWILDPAADLVWDSAGSIITAAGTEELAPTTDAGWDNVRNNAAIVAQTGNLLMLPDHALGQGDWIELSKGLVDAGVLAVKAAEAHDADALFKAGGQIYNVCRACHQQYIIGE